MSAIILDGLDITTSQEEVNEVIEKVGKVVSIEFARNPFTGVLLGSAKCVYDGDVAHLALEAFKEGCVIKGKTVQVSLAPPSVETQETPGASTSSLEETQPPPLTMNPDCSDFIDKLKEEGYEIKPLSNLIVTKPNKTRGDKQTTSNFPASFATLNQPPRLSFFVGDQKPKSGEADFETWKWAMRLSVYRGRVDLPKKSSPHW
ncbi:hypothetical protein HOLleu_00481 [Holothuria leucospilota]|uniref:RRM domain-containing protein n=1 Tax=Holothuria leucospilota TaxID=206669 RepID=A0A9Q1HK96_HOLLE|nr:hypothetical protein HOLleu_00481 [Holothuria leucospilota]